MSGNCYVGVYRLPHLHRKNDERCPTTLRSVALHGFIFLFPVAVPKRDRFSLRMEASCKQQCNVVEQTPSRLRAAAHFVCSIYQSKTDNEIYE